MSVQRENVEVYGQKAAGSYKKTANGFLVLHPPRDESAPGLLCEFLGSSPKLEDENREQA